MGQDKRCKGTHRSDTNPHASPVVDDPGHSRAWGAIFDPVIYTASLLAKFLAHRDGPIFDTELPCILFYGTIGLVLQSEACQRPTEHPL